MKIYFATGNKGKFREAKELFESAGLPLEQYKIDLLEIQSDSLEEIALLSAREAYKIVRKPLFVEDAGLFIKSLKSFPGPFSKYTLFTIGLKGILKLIDGKNRAAEFRSVVAYVDGKKEKVFKGICKGTISHTICGSAGFGYDPIFIPEGGKKTFGEDFETKQKMSHRARSVTNLANWLKKHG